MEITYATLKLTNLFNRQAVEVNVLVDTGAPFMCVTEEIALQLGFDTTEPECFINPLRDVNVVSFQLCCESARCEFCCRPALIGQIPLFLGVTPCRHGSPDRVQARPHLRASGFESAR